MFKKIKLSQDYVYEYYQNHSPIYFKIHPSERYVP